MALENIVEASIEQLSTALEAGSITSTELVSKYLLRIAEYDCRNTSLNAIPLINPKVFDEAAAADRRRASDKRLGVLDGIPFTVKDSYKVKNMTVASGSEAFESLIANEDAFVVSALRSAGAVLIGKTNMCPMAYGGMLRGLYGRAESPYNRDYLAAAFGSGSSNGSGVATAASFAAFGMGEETVSSGRSPASNNGLVAYTPSRGYISIRGNWPLYPTCDVIVPHTRSVDDLLYVLNVITAQDSITRGDFWRDQPFIESPKYWPHRPKDFCSTRTTASIKGLRIAVPRMYVTTSTKELHVSSSVVSLWNETKAVLESAGALVKVIEGFPVLKAYEDPSSATGSEPRLPDDWNSTERGTLIAHAWEDFLASNASTDNPSLKGISPTKIFPHLPASDPQVRFTEPANMVKWAKLAEFILDKDFSSDTSRSPTYDILNLKEALEALEGMRIHYFEDWLQEKEFDVVAFPAAGDVGKADADINVDSAEHSWRNGVKYSHGNRMLRHLGIPSITVPMGVLEGSGMPMGLTFLGPSGSDSELLRTGWSFEQVMQAAGKGRQRPQRTPPLATDICDNSAGIVKPVVPNLLISECVVAGPTENGKLAVNVRGVLEVTREDGEIEPIIQLYVNGHLMPGSIFTSRPARTRAEDVLDCDKFDFLAQCSIDKPPPQDARNTVAGKVARDSTMIMVLARNGRHGKPVGYLKMIHQSEQHGPR